MALKLDSNAVLRAIADNPDAFPALGKDVDAFAQKVLSKQIKDKSVDLALAKHIRHATGESAMATILDGLAPNEVIAILKKLDPHNPIAASNDPRAIRAIVDDLLAGHAAPMAKQEKPVKLAAPKKPSVKAPPKPKIGDVMDSKVHAGTAKRSRAKAAT